MVGIRVKMHLFTQEQPVLRPIILGRSRKDLASAGAPGQHRQADIGGDPVEPGAKRRTLLEAIDLAPGSHQCLLERVIGIVNCSEHPIAVNVEFALERLRQLRESALIPRDRRGEMFILNLVATINDRF
jgi:hypothetical protein